MATKDIPMLKDLPQGLRVKLHQEPGTQLLDNWEDGHFKSNSQMPISQSLNKRNSYTKRFPKVVTISNLKLSESLRIYMPTLISARWMSEEFLELDEPLMLKYLGLEQWPKLHSFLPLYGGWPFWGEGSHDHTRWHNPPGTFSRLQ